MHEFRKTYVWETLAEPKQAKSIQIHATQTSSNNQKHTLKKTIKSNRVIMPLRGVGCDVLLLMFKDICIIQHQKRERERENMYFIYIYLC